MCGRENSQPLFVFSINCNRLERFNKFNTIEVINSKTAQIHFEIVCVVLTHFILSGAGRNSTKLKIFFAVVIVKSSHLKVAYRDKNDANK